MPVLMRICELMNGCLGGNDSLAQAKFSNMAS